ncbi:MAG: hypothetical protein M3443_07455 [Actinomycetota bacterium]|nr:hypothetical protein [Actinomycetota bacterium]
MYSLEEDKLQIVVSLSIAGCKSEYKVYDEDVEFVFTGAEEQTATVVFTREGLHNLITSGTVALSELDVKLAALDAEMDHPALGPVV